MFRSSPMSPPGRSVAAPGVDPVSPRDFAGLPGPVATYLRRAIPIGTAPPAALKLEQTGEMLLGRRWRAFTATEWLHPPPGGFTWEAAVHLAPFITTRVRDSYTGGVGAMRATVAGLTIVDARPDPALDEGALHRYLAECVWVPTALLPRYAVVWSPLDGSRAHAALADAGNHVSLEFTFTRQGEVAQVFTPARARTVDGRFEPTPWRAQMTRYDERGGFWMPVDVEVAWMIDGVWEPCWRGQVGSVTTEDQPIATSRGA